METKDLKGKAQSVLGLIQPADLGITLMHEHIAIDGTLFLTKYLAESQDPYVRELAYGPLRIGSRYHRWARFYPMLSLENNFLNDEELATNEVMNFKRAGGGTINEATAIGLGRDPTMLVRVSEATGINIISSAGFYMADAYAEDRSKEELEEEVVKDILIGIGETGVHAGAIKVGVPYPLRDIDKKNLQACVSAQKRTGAFMNIHSGPVFGIESAKESLKYVDSLGADLSRIVLCHTDMSDSTLNERLELINTGCCLAYDGFGKIDLFPAFWGEMDMISDARRIRQIVELIDKGFLNQIVISQDVCTKVSLAAYGGWGYGYILENLQPHMIARGMSEKDIKTIMVDNPRRLLTFV